MTENSQISGDVSRRGADASRFAMPRLFAAAAVVSAIIFLLASLICVRSIFACDAGYDMKFAVMPMPIMTRFYVQVSRRDWQFYRGRLIWISEQIDPSVDLSKMLRWDETGWHYWPIDARDLRATDWNWVFWKHDLQHVSTGSRELIGIPLWPVIPLSAILPGLWWKRTEKRAALEMSAASAAGGLAQSDDAVLSDPSCNECYRCGYDLRGIAGSQPCPECGLLAQRSRRVTDELHETRPRWLKSISRGANLILTAIAATLLWPACAAQIAQRRNFNSEELFLMYGLAAAAAMLFLGIILLTRAEGYPPADRADRRRRMILRCVAALPLTAALLETRDVRVNPLVAWILLALQVGKRMTWISYDEPTSLIGFFVFVFLGAGAILLPALFFYQLRSLAKRARSAHLAEHCAIVGIGTSIAMAFLVVLAILFTDPASWGLDENWMNRSPAAMIFVLILAAAGFLFAVWSLYLLARFAIAFRRASLRMKYQWKRDDLAAA